MTRNFQSDNKKIDDVIINRRFLASPEYFERKKVRSEEIFNKNNFY